MLIAILTVFVFYIPACEHKITYSISILVTLTVFYLVGWIGQGLGFLGGEI